MSNKWFFFALLGLCFHTPCFAACTDTNAFLNSVNSAWISTNYALLEQTLSNRVTDCTNDLLAKGLLYEYYDTICIDYYKARAAASAFILATSNRMPSEIIHRRDPMELPLLLCELPIPTNFPTDQSKTPEQMQYLHRRYSDAFPHLISYQSLMYRIEAIEQGLVTNGYFNPLNRD